MAASLMIDSRYNDLVIDLDGIATRCGPGLITQGCSSACSAVGRFVGFIVSIVRTKWHAVSETFSQRSFGSNEYLPAHVALISSCSFSKSKGREPQRRKYAMTPMAQMSTWLAVEIISTV